MADKDIPLFVMEQPATFKWPVKVPVPVDGGYRYAEFTAIFPNVAESEIQALMAQNVQGQPTRSDVDVAGDVLKGFEGINAPDGSPVVFTPENKAALLAAPRVAGAVAGTFLMAVRGMAAGKNS